jgi:rhodanese-related sulfurtransferase
MSSCEVDMATPLSEPEIADRLLRVGWSMAEQVSARGVPLLPVGFVAEQGRALQLIDVREADELTGRLGHIPGVVWVPFAQIGRVAEELTTEVPVVLVCDTSERSQTAAQQLRSLGMTSVAALEGGVRAWRDRGYETTREEAVLARTSPTPAAVPAFFKKSILSLADIERHIGDPQAVHWAKYAGFMLHGKTSCVDGRDDHGVVGTPGGDAGEFVLLLSAIEVVSGRQLDAQKVSALLEAYVATFGHFYLHSDGASLNRYIAAMRADPRIAESLLPLRTDPPLAWRRFASNVPTEIRPFVREHLLNPDHVGCGHLKFLLSRSEAYGVRRALIEQMLAAFFSLRWEGLHELEFVPLGGGHREGAVVNVRLADPMQPYRHIPLVSPSVEGVQMFVNHPDVTSWQRRLAATWAAEQPMLGIDGQAEALAEAMNARGAHVMGLTLAALANGLPIYDVTFSHQRQVTVRHVGNVGG